MVYESVTELLYGVFLFVADDWDNKAKILQLRVPYELLVDDEGRGKLTDAIQNLQMYIMSLGD